MVVLRALWRAVRRLGDWFYEPFRDDTEEDETFWRSAP